MNSAVGTSKQTVSQSNVFCSSWLEPEIQSRVMENDSLSRPQLQAAIAYDIVTRLIDSHESTSRRALVIKYKDSDVISYQTSPTEVLSAGPTNIEEYLPNIATFQLTGKEHIINLGKHCLVLVLNALQTLALESPPDANLNLGTASHRGANSTLFALCSPLRSCGNFLTVHMCPFWVRLA